jgi:hypothetical protein
MPGQPAHDARQVHVDLELDVDAEPIRGTVRSGAAVRQFSGWLALISELDGLRGAQTGHTEEEST